MNTRTNIWWAMNTSSNIWWAMNTCPNNWIAMNINTNIWWAMNIQSNKYLVRAMKASLFNRSTVSVTAERFISVVHNRHWYFIIPCLFQTRQMCFEVLSSWYLCKPGWTPSQAASTLCLWWSSPSPGTSPALTSSPPVIQQSRWWSYIWCCW